MKTEIATTKPCCIIIARGFILSIPCITTIEHAGKTSIPCGIYTALKFIPSIPACTIPARQFVSKIRLDRNTFLRDSIPIRVIRNSVKRIIFPILLNVWSIREEILILQYSIWKIIALKRNATKTPGHKIPPKASEFNLYFGIIWCFGGENAKL
jgi:hypothetical protein